MSYSNSTPTRAAVATWLREALHPVQTVGEYFDTLRETVEASAPVCYECR